MEECIFCKIVAGTIPSYRVAESKHFLAILDITPATHGHTLIIPKQHYENLLLLPTTLGDELIVLVQKVAPVLMKLTESQGCNIGVNNGPVAGQVVMHLHVHIIPRKENDGLSHWPRSPATSEELTDFCQMVREKL